MDKRTSFNDTVDNWLELSGDGLKQFYEADLLRRTNDFDQTMSSPITFRPNRRLCESPVRNFATTPTRKNSKHEPSIKVEREALSLTPMPALIENKRSETSSERHHRKGELADSNSTFNRTFNDGSDGNESIQSLVRYVKHAKGTTGDEINNYVMKYCHERSVKNFIPPPTPALPRSSGRHCDTCCCQPKMKQLQEESQMQMPVVKINEPHSVRIVQQKRKGRDFETVNEVLVGRIKVQNSPEDDFTPSLNSSPDTVILANGDIDKTITPTNSRGYDNVVTGRCLKPEFDNCLTGTNEKKRQPIVTSSESASSSLSPPISSTVRQKNKTPKSIKFNDNTSSSANGSMSPEPEDCSFIPMKIPIVLTLACPKKRSNDKTTNSQPIRVLDVQTSMGTCNLFDKKAKPIFGIRKNVKFQEPSSEKASKPTPRSSKAIDNASCSGPSIQLELKGTISNWQFNYD